MASWDDAAIELLQTAPDEQRQREGSAVAERLNQYVV